MITAFGYDNICTGTLVRNDSDHSYRGYIDQWAQIDTDAFETTTADLVSPSIINDLINGKQKGQPLWPMDRVNVSDLYAMSVCSQTLP